MCSGLLYHCISAIQEWRHLASDVSWYSLLAYWVVSRLSPGGATVSPSRYPHCWYGVFRRWIGGKRYIPQQKSPRKGTSVGCPLGDGKSVGVTECLPWPVGWSQIAYDKKRVFPEIWSINANLSGIWNHMLRDTTWTSSWEVWRKSIQEKWQKWCMVHVTKNQRLCDPFFRTLSETHSVISLETCKA